MKWTKGEKGPICGCGFRTAVIEEKDGKFSLLCIVHTTEAGALWPLPDERPEKWPDDLTDEELEVLIGQGRKEHGRDEADL